MPRLHKGEVTSARIASIAGKVLRLLDDSSPNFMIFWTGTGGWRKRETSLRVDELQALAASALTQTRNKGPIEVTARRKKPKTARPKKAGRVGRK